MVSNIINEDFIDIDKFFEIMLLENKLELDSQVVQNIVNSRSIIDSLGQNNIPIYGVTTGFGEMINRLIPNQFSAKLQKNLIRSHATGVGQELNPLVIRAILLVRLITFTKGHSGISLPVVNQILTFLNKELYPVIHAQGSLGASGDLSPLAEMALGLIGESEYFNQSLYNLLIKFDSIYNSGFQSFRSPDSSYISLALSYKEGLSLINGTGAMTAIALFNVRLAKQVYLFHMVATALTLVALKASSMPFDHVGVSLKGHVSMNEVSDLILYLIKDAGLIRDQKDIISRLKIELDEGKTSDLVVKTNEFLQNAYSLRVIPQVVGGFLDIYALVKSFVEDELNGIDDNPITITKSAYKGDSLDLGKESYIYHGAHFHGQYIAYAMDWLKIPIIQMAQLSDRRIARLIDSKYNEGLTDLLAADQAGLSCAFEGLQYTSTSVVAEMKALSIPCSIQSIPSNLNNQDLVSIGMVGARQTWDILSNAVTVTAVELRTALQALELRLRQELNLPSIKGSLYDIDDDVLELYMGKRLLTVYKFLVEDLSCIFVRDDRHLANDMKNLRSMIIGSMFAPENNPILEMLGDFNNFRDFTSLMN